MEVTDEMVETACRAFDESGDKDTGRDDAKFWVDGPVGFRNAMRRALEAALFVPTTPPPNTRRVRIAVAMSPDGTDWCGHGASDFDGREPPWRVVQSPTRVNAAIVEADVPLPVVPTVRGRVE